MLVNKSSISKFYKTKTFKDISKFIDIKSRSYRSKETRDANFEVNVEVIQQLVRNVFSSTWHKTDNAAVKGMFEFSKTNQGYNKYCYYPEAVEDDKVWVLI